MKKYLSIVCICILAFVATACNGQPNVTNTNELKIVTTNFPAYDFARAVVGNDDNITMLLKPGQDSHTYDPTPQDIININEADIFIYTGGDSDTWVDGILDSIDNDIQTIRMMDYVDIYTEEIVEGMQNDHHHDHDHDHDDHNHDHDDHDHNHDDHDHNHDDHDHDHDDDHVHYDEHIWTSPINAIRLIEVMEEEISKLDSTNASTYAENANAYIVEIEEIDEAIREVVSNSARTELIFGDRFPFRYFVEEYNLSYYAAFPGCSAETEASAQTIAFLVDRINETNNPVVLHIELSNTNIANTIAEETGATVLQLHSAHNVTDTDFADGKTYADFMRENIDTLKEALQ